jgi:hypothetical protein
MNRIIRDEKGHALVLALILLLIGGLIIPPLLSFMGTGLLVGQVYEKGTAELYAADAGVEKAIWRIQRGTGLGLGQFMNYFIPDVNVRTVAVTTTLVNNQTGNRTYRITSTATTDNNSQTTIVAHVSLHGGGGGEVQNPLDYGVITLNGTITTRGDLIMRGHSINRTAHIYAHGNIGLQGICRGCYSRAMVRATATGSITLPTHGARVLAGPMRSNHHPPKQFALPDPSVWREEAQRGRTIHGDFVLGRWWGGSATLGPARITGNLMIVGSARLTGPVWVDGRIEMVQPGWGPTRLKGKGPLVAVGNIQVRDQINCGAPEWRPSPGGGTIIVSTQGHINVGSADWDARRTDFRGILYAPNGTIYIRGRFSVVGVVIGRDVITDTSIMRELEDGTHQVGGIFWSTLIHNPTVLEGGVRDQFLAAVAVPGPSINIISLGSQPVVRAANAR